jgi:hypothetical protein
MKRIGTTIVLVALLALTSAGTARAATIVGVIKDYESGNQGTDLYVKTADGHVHDLWFDNMKKPSFEGKQLPWCPDFPCQGWPPQLVFNKTHVRVYVVNEVVDGKAIQSPTKIELAP